MKLVDLEINGERLAAGDIRERVADLRAERRLTGEPGSLDEGGELQSHAQELLIDRTLLLQEARRLALRPSQTEVEQMLASLAGRYDGVAGCRAGSNTPLTQQDLRSRMTIDRILEHWRSSVRRPRPEDVNKHYSAHKDQFYAPETVNAAQIVRSAERYADSQEGLAELDALRTRVQNGEAFEKVAREHSDCPENEGELGWFPRGVMVEQFDEIVFSAPVGELSPAFETSFGYHFALVRARRAAGIRPLSEVRREIEEALWLSKQDREVGRRLADLRTRAVIRSLS